MKRREFLAGAAAVPLSGAAHAAGSCSPFVSTGYRQCTVGLQNVRTIYQECQQWCWAACAELAFEMQGIGVDQHDFVLKAYGAMVCQPANGPMIQRAINGPWTNRWGNTRYAEMIPVLDADANIGHPDLLEAIRLELAADRLMIAGTYGHAVCMTAMTYAENQYGQREVLEIVVRDPWPTSGNRYIMTSDQFWNMRFLAAVRFA